MFRSLLPYTRTLDFCQRTLYDPGEDKGEDAVVESSERGYRDLANERASLAALVPR